MSSQSSMAEIDNNVSPAPAGNDGADGTSPKPRSRSPPDRSLSLSQAIVDSLAGDAGARDSRRKRRSSSRSQPPEGIVQAQVFNLDPEQRGRPGARMRQGTPSPHPAGVVTPPAPDAWQGSPASPGPDAPQDQLRQWSIGMFAQHEQIIRDIFTRVATETAGLGQRVAQL